MNIKQTIQNATKKLKENNINEPFLKANILLCYTIKKEREYLITHDEEELQENILNKYNTYINRLINGEPLQYISKKQEFMGLNFKVTEGVLIPRPDTEILVEEVINILKKEEKTNVLDLCTGTGAIGISIAKHLNNSKVTLVDISNKALKVARENCLKNSVKIDAGKGAITEIIKSDLFSNIKKTNKFDLIVSNPPYIKTEVIKTLEKQVQKEPIIALDGGKDGLEFYKKIIEQADEFLNKNGYLCLEIGYDQKKDIIELIEKSKKYNNIYSKKDLAGNDRIIICNRI